MEQMRYAGCRTKSRMPLRSSGLRVGRFEFKAVHPLFDVDPFEVCCRFGSGNGIDLWARDKEGRLAMQARLEAAP